jgi:BolA protein
MSIQELIESKLMAGLAPVHLEVVNESHMHNVPPGSETHFKVVLVSPAFEGLRKVARHRLVYAELAAELAGPVHALSLHTYTAGEWQARGAAPQSPQCLGGSRHDHREQELSQ